MEPNHCKVRKRNQHDYSDAEKRRIADDYELEKSVSGVSIRKYALRVNIPKSTLIR
ncbi:hypothetical protein RvY_11712 [Ramazzottius varieornatus]|uniref:HTH psq-type domain-containing protein n=1 Tax=Ramazzottius varieornatus TaxID=947166 RepID=A0A1D1VH33_RAMVA|nr:hypothetical protein RvY_11712 [Ramazzottius varieornatus]